MKQGNPDQKRLWITWQTDGRFRPRASHFATPAFGCLERLKFSGIAAFNLNAIAVVQANTITGVRLII